MNEIAPRRRGTLRPALASGLAAVAVLALVPTSGGAADEPTGRQIMTRVTEDHRTDDERAEAEMIIMGKGTPRRRTVTLLFARAEGSDDKLVVRFEEPAEIRGTGLLTIEHGETEDQWLYLPALRKTRRIASGSKSERFAGTDFTYEDLRTEEVSAHDYKVLKSDSFEGHACWVIEAHAATETKKKETAYGKRIIWVRKDHFIPLRVEYYDKRDRPVKRLTNSGWKELEGGKWRFFKAQMEDLSRGTQTLMKYASRKLDVGLEDREFTKEALSRG